MNWWGKIVGSSVGLIAGPIGAVIGGYLGHQFDEKKSTCHDEKRAMLMYYAYFFSSAAKIAKADGKISAKEIEKVESIIERMRLSSSLEKFAKDIFRKSKTSKRSINLDFKECAALVQYNQSIAHSFMGGLFEIATCQNKKPSKTQVHFLMQGQESFKMPKGTIRDWYSGGYAVLDSNIDERELKSCYEILGVSEKDNISVIKKAYRRKISAFHPDKLENKQLPDELIVFAKQQVIQLNLAFEKINKSISSKN